jgi:hypothetical protein
MGHHASEREALGRVAQGVDEARLTVTPIPDIPVELGELRAARVEAPA